MSQLPVLIIGAGPTGLMMACELERHDIPFRIIDKKPEPTQGSNATWIQTRTLEIFDAIGMIDPFLKKGHQCEAINFYLKGKQIVQIPLNQIDSTYPFILMLPQSETERLLNEKLAESKIPVERSRELINIQQTNNGIISTLRFPSGETEDIISDWVIACDGANSTVREQCQIPFPGEDIPEQFMVADAKMSSYLPTEEIHVFFDKGTIFPEKGTLFSAFPWGSKDYRLSANLYSPVPRQTFHPHEIKEVVADRTYGNFIVESVSWISPFWIHGKIVDQMRHGSIFFAGDAAHIHSPAGGQGMNTGIQDAFNLAWKLALVIKRKALPSLLDSYQLERYPIVKEIVNQTAYLTNMMLFDKSFFRKLKKYSQDLSENSNLSKKISEELTQIKIQYKNSPAINYEEKLDIKSPHPGERIPDVLMEYSKHLYGYLQNTMHNVLIFTGDQPSKNDLASIDELQNLIKQKFSELVKVFVITNKNLPNVDNIISDKDGAIHQKFNVNEAAIYIIRPDNYIAYYSRKLDPIEIIGWIRRFL